VVPTSSALFEEFKPAGLCGVAPVCSRPCLGVAKEKAIQGD
jgi:hypothetical protein